MGYAVLKPDPLGTRVARVAGMETPFGTDDPPKTRWQLYARRPLKVWVLASQELRCELVVEPLALGHTCSASLAE